MRLAALLVFVGIAGVVLAAGPRSPPTAGSAEVVAASGSVRIESSGNGRALLVARRLAPGRRVEGRLDLRNRGSGPATLRLTQSVVSSRPGRGGASLLGALRLTIRESRGKVVFDGPISKLRTKKMRRLGGRATRRYAFVATLPRTADNRYQAATLVVRYRWTATGAARFTRTKRGR